MSNKVINNPTDYIIEKISFFRALSLDSTRKIFTDAIRDYLSEEIDDTFIAELSGKLANVFNEFEDIYKSDHELGGLLHDCSEMNRFSIENKQKMKHQLEQYLKNLRL